MASTTSDQSDDEFHKRMSKPCRKLYMNMVKLGITTPFVMAGVTGLPVYDIIAWSNKVENFYVNRTMVNIIMNMIKTFCSEIQTVDNS